MATAVEVITTLLTLSGLAYMLIALWGARDFAHHWTRTVQDPPFTPDVTILKPIKGMDARMYAGFASHCRQVYAGKFEIIFGVSSLDDPAAKHVERLRYEFPACSIRIVECKESLGASGKVSNLVQMLREAHYSHVLINDSDIRVSPNYLTRVLACFADPKVGMATAPYLGKTSDDPKSRTIWSRLEALGISTDFMPGVLTARKLEGGIRFGLGSTLAMSRIALEASGGLEPLVDSLADDYELGARIARAGFRVELCNEVVETTVPAYSFRNFWDHQIRWARSTRDSRRWGYAGLGITYCIPWALMNCVASGFALWSFTLLSLVLLARVSVALSVGVGLLRDDQVLRDICLLPLRDFCGLIFWAWSFASNEVIWRGEKFRLHGGQISKVE